MTLPFHPVAVAEEFIYAKLSGDSGVQTALTTAGGGATDIYPRVSPAGAAAPHITHDFAGPDGGIIANPIGQGPGLIEIRWIVVSWNPAFDVQVLAPINEAVQAVLLGPQMVGTSGVFVSARLNRSYGMVVQWAGPAYVPGDVNPLWQRLGDYYQLALQQRS